MQEVVMWLNLYEVPAGIDESDMMAICAEQELVDGNTFSKKKRIL